MNNLQPREDEPTATAPNSTSEERIGRSGQPFPETRVEGPSTVHIRDLVADPHNRRKHNPRNVGLIVNTMHFAGFGRSVLIDEDNVLLAGNATIDAAAEAGITRVQVVDADGETIIAVRRRGLTDEQKRHLATADNRATDLSEFDGVQLRADLDAGLDLSAFWSDTELADLLGADAPVPHFEPVEAEHQLDSLADNVVCPACGHAWHQEAK